MSLLVTAIVLSLFYGGGAILKSYHPCDDVNLDEGNCTYEMYREKHKLK